MDKFLLSLNQNHILVLPFHEKEVLLNMLFEHSILPQFKIYTFEELKSFVAYDIDEHFIFQFSKQNQFSMEIAKIYLDNLYYVDIKKEYKSKKLRYLQQLKENIAPLIKDTTTHIFYLKKKQIIFYGYDAKQKEITAFCNLYQLPCQFYQQNKTENDLNIVYSFNSAEEEIDYISYKIATLIEDNVPLSKIKICHQNENINFLIQKKFKLFHIPLASKQKYYNEIPFFKNFISVLKSHSSINQSLDFYQSLYPKEKYSYYYDALIQVCNLLIDLNYQDFIFVMAYYFQTKLFNDVDFEESITIIDYHQSINPDDYLFVVGFNQGQLPLIYKDEDFLSDEEKEELSLLTSNEKNKIEKELLHDFLIQSNHLFISFHQKENSTITYPSSLIDQWKLKVLTIQKDFYHTYSIINDQLRLADYFDKNIENDESLLLKKNYSLQYRTYQNQFKVHNIELLKNTIKNKNIELSYSPLDSFFQCSFKYYCTTLLSLNDKNSSFAQDIGSLFHYILAKSQEEPFNFEDLYHNYLTSKKITNKEQFYYQKLKKELKYLLDYNDEMKQHTHLKKVLCEQRLIVEKNDKLPLSLKGFIDKMMIYEDKNQTYIALIDYKTGNPHFDLNYLQFGLSMQLPVYMYLVHHVTPYQQSVVVGFYLQKILQELNKVNQDIEESKRNNLKLQGFTLNNPQAIAIFDDTYESSLMVKGLKTKKDGTFSKNSKILSFKDMEEIEQVVENKIIEAANQILNGEFKIEPKIINHKNESCAFCEFKNLCYVKANNNLYLSTKEEGEEDV